MRRALTSSGAEGRRRGRRELDREAHGPVLARSHRSLGDQHRLRRVHDDACLALSEEAVAERRDEAFAVLAGALRQAEHDIGQVDNDAIGIGEREHLGLHAGGQIEEEGRRCLAAGELGVGRADATALLGFWLGLWRVGAVLLDDGRCRGRRHALGDGGRVTGLRDGLGGEGALGTKDRRQA